MSPALVWTSVGFLFLSVTASSVRGETAELAALAEDDGQCSSVTGEDGACALSARQLRSLKVSDTGILEDSDGGRCESYGCVGYTSSHSCQCNSECHDHGNCCSDFEATCASSDEGSCKSYGCVAYSGSHSCQCNSKCRDYGNCCSDFEAKCAVPAGAKAPSAASGGLTVPPGVNLGGWLVLEDWFFSGKGGRHVMSTGSQGQGVCLPPLLHGSKETWPSEGLLTKWLERSRGKEAAVEVFDAHRHAFIGESDLQDIAKLGIRQVRLPVPWTTFADALASLDPAYASDAKLVPDPFYTEEASFVTVNRDWLAKFLRKAAQHGLKIFLDMHTMPGGSSDATYSGVWPLPPKFWNGDAQIGKSKVPLTKVGLWIVDAFIKWVERLPAAESSAVAGLTLLNEPGHMSHLDAVKGKPFTHSEEQVMDWNAAAADRFRKSTLPGKGLKLYVSVIDSAFKYYWDTAPRWWHKTFTSEERHSWAVFDIHFYDAWTPKCSGRIAPGGGYVCSQPLEEIRSLVHSCHTDFMGNFSKNVDGLKACTEFSAATFEDPILACKDESLLQMYLEEQVNTFKRFEIDAFFWSWRMPYGRNFESAWSLKHLAGLEKPVGAAFGC